MLRPLLLAAALVAAPACAATRDWPLTGFERVQLAAIADMTVRTAPAFTVHAEGDPELLNAIDATVRDGTLYVGWKARPIRLHDRKLTIAIAMPRVAGAGLKGVGHIVVEGAAAPLTVFAVDGTGSLGVTGVRSDKTVLALSGTGSIEVAGATGHLDARRSGIGSIDATKLQARSAVLVSSGVGSLDARVDGPADVTQSGIGSVEVHGHPVCTTRRSGIGSVECGA
jgi:hypothetical protein